MEKAREMKNKGNELYHKEVEVEKHELKGIVCWVESTMIYIEAFQRMEILDDPKLSARGWKTVIAFVSGLMGFVESQKNDLLVGIL